MKKGRSNHASSSKRFSLPKADILRGRKNFQRLFNTPATGYSENCIHIRFQFFPDHETVCKMGFIAAKRLGKATERNHVKRLLREAYRLHRHPLREVLLSSAKGFHGVLVAKTTEMDFKTVEKEVISLLDRIIRDLHSTFDS